MRKSTHPPASDSRLAAFLSSIRNYDDAEIALAVDTLIAELDARAADHDLEPDDEDEDDDPDCCEAGDDRIISGRAMGRLRWTDAPAGHEIGDDEDAEHSCPAAHGINQTLPLILTAANDPGEWRATA